MPDKKSKERKKRQRKSGGTAIQGNKVSMLVSGSPIVTFNRAIELIEKGDFNKMDQVRNDLYRLSI